MKNNLPTNLLVKALIIFGICSCGVKKAPRPPQGTNLPSITERYEFKLEKENKEKKAKKAEDKSK